jgi:hypothetical protein
MSYQPIENYGIIGNMRTVALVGMNGSIDWYCYLWLLGRVLACDFLEVLHGGFDDRDAAEKKLLELARLRSQILVAVLLLDAAQVVAKHPDAEAACEGDSSLWFLLEQGDAQVRCRESPCCTKVCPEEKECSICDTNRVEFSHAEGPKPHQPADGKH